MQHCYIDESFELVFEMHDPQDKDRKVDSATYRVIAPDKTIAQAGTMSVDEDGHTCRFRFAPTALGINTVEIAWSMGADRFRQPNLISVEDIS